MKVALLYPPPWKMAPAGHPPYPPGQGAPAGFQPGHVDGDFFQMPYGMLSLAAQVMRAGHQLKLLNLSAYAWPVVERVIGALDADLFGLSCFTANRRGVAYAAEAIKRLHPRSHVIVGGPHATALPRQMLERHAAIDSVAIGEGEETLLEVIARLERGEPVAGLDGLAARRDGAVIVSERRARIRELDSLASPHEHFDTHLMVTSRGCPGNCTFCATKSVWGTAYRVHSEERVLTDLERALSRLPLKMLTIKDETFSASRKRATRLCEMIVERGVKFVWSCDTRVDSVDESVIRAMRLAGCQRLSLGVESGSAQVLTAIGKRITPEKILQTTELAKKYGLPVRFFMMMGNRTENAARFRESIRFLDKAKPHQYIFACLSIYPGTQDYDDLVRSGRLDPSVYFDDDFQELKSPFDASPQDEREMTRWFEGHSGIQAPYQPTIEELEAVLERLPGFWGAHMDLGGAHYRAGAFDQAEFHLKKALELEHPQPGLVHNYLACIAYARGDIDGMHAAFDEAQADPWHPVLMRNRQRVDAWLRAGGGALELEARHDFELFDRTVQPSLPGPLPGDLSRWS